MKTIEQAVKEFCEERSHRSDGYPPKKWFEAGVKLAEEWYPIERDASGYITDRQKDEMKQNVPYLTKHRDKGIEVFSTVGLILRYDEKYTDWRPINRK